MAVITTIHAMPTNSTHPLLAFEPTLLGLKSRKRYWPAIWARLAITSRAAAMIPQPPIQPVLGPNARAPHVNVVPQSGSLEFSSLYAKAMKSMGMKAITVTIGACRPIATTTNPSVAARLYAGAVDATATTVVE